MVNRMVKRTSSLVSLMGNILGVIGGAVQGLRSLVSLYFIVLAWWRRRRDKGEEEPLVVLIAGPEETGTWVAQAAWNKRVAEWLGKLDSRIDALEVEFEALRA